MSSPNLETARATENAAVDPEMALDAICRQKHAPLSTACSETSFRDGGSLIVSSKDFVAPWAPPDFVVEGVFQQRYLYAITAPAGTGKTAIALTLAAHVALGEALGGHTVNKGRVLYFAGENPDDIRTRWLLLGEKLGFDPETIDVDFVCEAFPMASKIDKVLSAASDAKPYALVIVDTSAAYYSGDDENDNVEARKHAQILRRLIGLPGGPCVLVISHPPKGSGRGRPTSPRGGSAFLNEIDGNTYLTRNGQHIDLRQAEKFRGPNFSSIGFDLETVCSSKRKDRSGRPIPSIAAIPEQAGQTVSTTDGSETALLRALQQKPGASVRDLGKAAGLSQAGKDIAGKASRVLQKLRSRGLSEQDTQGHWHLTKQGEMMVSTDVNTRH